MKQLGLVVPVALRSYREHIAARFGLGYEKADCGIDGALTTTVELVVGLTTSPPLPTHLCPARGVRIGFGAVLGQAACRERYALARPLYKRALTIDERVLGPDHPNAASSLNNLAWLLQDQGELAAARPLLERALAI